MCLQAPISVYPFPSEDEVDKRQVWIKSVNREYPKNPRKNWLTNSYSRICSNNFVDSIPTLKNPYQTLNQGHSQTVSAPRKPLKTRGITLKNDSPAKKPKTEPSNCVSQPHTIVPSSLDLSTTVSYDYDYDNCHRSSCITNEAEIKKS